MTYFLPPFLCCFWVCPIDIAFPFVLPRKSARSGTVTFPVCLALTSIHARFIVEVPPQKIIERRYYYGRLQENP